MTTYRPYTPPPARPQQTTWVDSGLDASFVFHFAAGWEEETDDKTGGDVIRLYAMKYDHFELDFDGTFYNATDPSFSRRFTRADLDARCVHAQRLVDFVFVWAPTRRTTIIQETLTKPNLTKSNTHTHLHIYTHTNMQVEPPV